MPDNEEKEALERFLLDNPELDSIEGALSQFNVFETLNMVNAEVRHSNLLAWLLRPYPNHDLGDDEGAEGWDNEHNSSHSDLAADGALVILI